MTASTRPPSAAPWYCSHESSTAATSTMLAAGLVAAASLMTCIALSVAGDEVAALIAAMVMLVAGANTWSAGRSRTWWRAEPAPSSGVRSAPRPRAATPAPVVAPVARPRPAAAVPLTVTSARRARVAEPGSETADTVVLARLIP